MHPILGKNSYGWTDVEIKLDAGRRQLQSANIESEYQAVGLLCRETIVMLGKFVLHERFEGKLEATSESDANRILQKLIDNELPGSSNEAMRAFTKSCLGLANTVQHSSTTTYAQASVCIEACTTLKNMIRILLWHDEAHPGKGSITGDFSSGETDFMVDCMMNDFNNHHVVKTEGFTIKGMEYGVAFITVNAISGLKYYSATAHKNQWFKGANRKIAAMLVDELIVKLLAEKRQDQIEKATGSST
ncbi:MAG: hypothetical protein WBZ48_13420 [Bacteroidota bacterium]